VRHFFSAAILIALVAACLMVPDAPSDAQTPPATGGCLTQDPSTGVWTNHCTGADGTAITSLTGDVVATAPGASPSVIQAGVVTLAKQANLAASSIECNTSGSAATPQACNVAQTNTLLGLKQTLSATTGSITGTSLAAGACDTGTASVASSTTSMVASASPVTYPGDGFYWVAYVSTAGTVTVKLCATVAGTPTSSVYNVRVTQ
jgi:hypothetical protein